MDYLNELTWRGMLHQATADEVLHAHLSTPGRVAYAGFDPTSSSLTVGNLVPIMMLRHWQLAGHQPIVVMGGGTGLIGDPSGKDDERRLLSAEQVASNVAGQEEIIRRILDCDPSHLCHALFLDNETWLSGLGYIEFLRDVGKYFSVNMMIQKDSVRERLHEREQGISYTEFSYMLLQAWDFLHLHRAEGCTVQIAGSDQYGNIVSGIDLIRRMSPAGVEQGPEAFGITAPLITKADGTKFGKTEEGAIWLSADMTSPYQFFQFWLNTTDDDVEPYLKCFTLLGREEIEDIVSRHRIAPHERIAQRALAETVTGMIHGEDTCTLVQTASQALFSGEVQDLSADLLETILSGIPSSERGSTDLEGEGCALVDLLSETGLAGSKREAREFLDNGAISVNGHPVEESCRLTGKDLLHGSTVLLRRGRKTWHAIRWLSSGGG